MTNQIAMIITVGTSLRDNIRKQIINKNHELKKEILQDLKDKEVKVEKLITKYYDTYYSNFSEQLETGVKATNFPCAELQSFCFWLDQLDQKVDLKKILLLSTNTDESISCAKEIERILKEKVFNTNFAKNKIIINGSEASDIIDTSEKFNLRMENTDYFSEDLSELMEIIRGQLTENEKNKVRVILNITGGYKGVTPFFSLFGFLMDNIEMIYIHEDEKTLVRIPSLPLTWDFKLFDEYRTLVTSDNRFINYEPPGKFKMLFEKNGNKFQKNHFCETLQKIYHENRLKRFGYGMRLIQRLPNEYRRILIPEENGQAGGIYRWENIWMGDQIPETVEHSRGHSMRLMEYAASILEPCFRMNEKFLEDHELCCLICCLWLHDIGHTALTGTFDESKARVPVAIFPTLVRHLHHFLSDDLIKNLDSLPKDYRGAVAMISLYHRGKMPISELQNEDSKKEKWGFGLNPKPLKEELSRKPLFFGKKKLELDSAVLLCALLKFIDCLDFQSDRVVDDNYYQERKKRTELELSYLQETFKEKEELLDSCLDEKVNIIRELAQKNDEIFDVWKNLTGNLNDDWEKACRINEMIEKINFPGQLSKTIQEILNDTKDPIEQFIFLELLSLIDKIGFKMSTHYHFLKHSRVKLVYLTSRESHGQIYFLIRMIFDQNFNISMEDKKKLAYEIWKEAELVAPVLSDFGLYFDGIFDEADNSLCNGGN